MSSATDRLRELLDERGVEYRVSATGYSIDIGPYTTAYANRSDTTLDVSLRQVTPEQAIAATLGAVEYRKPTTLSQLEAENAKLRELVRAMWGCISHIGEYDVFYYDMAEDGCGMSCTVNGEHCCADKLHDRMRDLGIEVNE